MMQRRLCALAVLAMMVLIADGSRARAIPTAEKAVFGVSADVSTQRRLASARAVIGTDMRIRSVIGFTVQSADHHPTLRVRFPGAFRADFGSGVSHVLDGADYRLLQRPRSGGEPVRVPDPGDGRRERVIRQFAATTLSFLLRAPEALSVRAFSRGRLVTKGLSGDAIRFQLASGSIIHDLVLDPATSRPLGTTAIDKTSAGEVYTVVLRFLEFRTVAGLTVPARAHEEWVPATPPIGPWPRDSTYDIGTVIFDPPPTARDFRDPTPR